MTITARCGAAAAKHAESTYSRAFRHGDTVRCRDNDENCVVIGTWNDWLWLNPVDYRDAAPFTGRVYDYDLVGRA
jgi:hypothetical protein